jgi:hypothetical protein
MRLWFLFVSLLFAVQASAQIEPVGGELAVAQASGVFHRAPAVAGSELGSFVVVWQRHTGGPEGWDVVGRVYSRDGVPLGSQFVVNATTAGCQQRPAVAADRAGNFVVAWESEGQDGSGLGVFARRFASDGSALGGEILVNQTTAGDQRVPAVARNPSGSFLIAWQSEGSPPDGWSVFAKGFDDAGTPASPEILVNTTTAGAQTGPSAAWLNGSPTRYAVVWQSQGQDGSGSGVYRRTLTLDGLAQSSEQAVSATATGSQSHPSVTADASGNFTVVWETAGGLYARRFNVESNPLGGEVAVAAGLSEMAEVGRHPAVAGAASGDFVVAWERGADGSGGPSAIYARLFDHRQFPRGPELQVSTATTGAQAGPAAAAGAGSEVVVTWAGTPAAALDSAVLARRYAIPGLDFQTLPPCRVVDTRSPAGPIGGPVLTTGVQRTFTIAASACGVPASARALSLNITAIDATAGGYIAIYPGDTVFPMTSSINFMAGQNRANNAMASLSRDGFATLTALAGSNPDLEVHLVIDVNGYFE